MWTRAGEDGDLAEEASRRCTIFPRESIFDYLRHDIYIFAYLRHDIYILGYWRHGINIFGLLRHDSKVSGYLRHDLICDYVELETVAAEPFQNHLILSVEEKNNVLGKCKIN